MGSSKELLELTYYVDAAYHSGQSASKSYFSGSFAQVVCSSICEHLLVGLRGISLAVSCDRGLHGITLHCISEIQCKDLEDGLSESDAYGSLLHEYRIIIGANKECNWSISDTEMGCLATKLIHYSAWHWSRC
ncbi:hypothetical protein ACP70R_019634 [Stipagrostis hirtigluma subsp. patula]